TIALRDVIEDAVEELQLKQGRLPIRINLQLPADNPMTMQGNYDSLKSLFRNLLDNAFAYSGGRDIFIIYRGKEQRPEGEFYLLSFYDNGIGVEPEHLKSLFDRFYRVDAGRSRRLGGTGLGLSIVRNAVALHGGTIEAKNRKEGGLQFDFSLRV
ncbi:MAG: sensor histidine kinase, partial [Tidjanibacter sp.]|nr:sensor histidine kinase [Tidjanibacter sp.]